MTETYYLLRLKKYLLDVAQPHEIVKGNIKAVSLRGKLQRRDQNYANWGNNWSTMRKVSWSVKGR